MINISNVVKDIVYSSEIALSALAEGYLNLSAYAKSIQEEVETKAKKPVRTGSIVVALSRLRKSLRASRQSLLPKVIVDDLSVKSGLIEVAFDRTKENLDKLQQLYRDKNFSSTDFFIVTQGVGEINIIALEQAEKHILRIYKQQKPKIIIRNLVSLTVRFSEKYIETPNIIYALVRRFALKRMNIVEIVSTYTELTFVLRQDNLQEAFLTLNDIFRKDELDR